MLREIEELRSSVSLEAIRNRPSSIRLTPVELYDGEHFNLVVPSMTRGGAERCVRDVAYELEGRIRSGKLIIMGQVNSAYPLKDFTTFSVIRPTARERVARLRQVAIEVLSSPNPVAVTHMIRASDLNELWSLGVKTIPVVHNSEPGWHDPPAVYHNEHVPEVIAVCEDVGRQLRRAGLQKPITVLRHEIYSRGITYDPLARHRIRKMYGIKPATVLVGMVGQFKAHKCYVRAVRALAELCNHADVRLMILGGWEHDYGAGRFAHAATMGLADSLGVTSRLICPGSVDNVEGYYSAFDIFLNTSIYEGMSIATLEAVHAGCPVVSADVGGQREAIASGDRLIDDPSDIAAYVNAILATRRGKRGNPAAARQPDLVARVWAWKAEFGSLDPSSGARYCDTIFVTSNLNPGGAQRSLTNLLTAPGWTVPPWLCTLDRVLEDGLLRQLEQAGGTPILSLAHAGNLVTRVGSFLALVRRIGAKTVCFWNTDPVFKLLVAKVLEHSAVRIFDVSPGPMLYDELTETEAIQRRIAFTADDYIRRLDGLIAKYKGGLPDNAAPRQAWVVPNGVAVRRPDLPVDTTLLPPGANPDYALITCCRLVPNKRLEWLVELMSCLSQGWPEATLTVVGGVDQRHVAYFRKIEDLIATRGLHNLRFVGPRSDVFSFLPAFSQFVMVSRAQGCPNASLEAMACGLPVMANSDGGTAEQVIEGVTGYNINSDRPQDLAELIIGLFKDKKLRDEMGRNARHRVAEQFSMEKMLSEYLRILDWKDG